MLMVLVLRVMMMLLRVVTSLRLVMIVLRVHMSIRLVLMVLRVLVSLRLVMIVLRVLPAGRSSCPRRLRCHRRPLLVQMTFGRCLLRRPR